MATGNELAGHLALVKKAGTSTAMSGEAMSLVSGQVYEVTDSARRILDPEVAITVYDNAIAVAAADIENIDYLFGRVTFDSGYSVTGPVTLDANFYPTVNIAAAKEWSASHTRDIAETTTFGDNAKGKKALLKDATGNISAFAEIDSEILAAFNSADNFFIEWDPAGDGTRVKRYWVLFEGLETTASTDALVEDGITWQANGFYSVDGYPVGFSFQS